MALPLIVAAIPGGFVTTVVATAAGTAVGQIATALEEVEVSSKTAEIVKKRKAKAAEIKLFEEKLADASDVNLFGILKQKLRKSGAKALKESDAMAAMKILGNRGYTEENIKRKVESRD